MFLGHYAVALAAKKAAPQVRLGTLALAVQWLDLLWPLFLLLGIEQVAIEPHATRVTPLNFLHYPWSHSLLMAGLWAAGFAVIYHMLHRTLSHRSYAAGIIVGICVLSHWLLDWFSHRADLPLWPGPSPRYGLALWNHPRLSLAVEVGGFALALALGWIHLRSSVRPVIFWSWIGVLLLIGAGSYLGQVPPGVRPVMWSGFAQWALVAWAFAVEPPPSAH